MYDEINGSATLAENLAFVTNQVPIVIPMLFFFIFLFITITGYTTQKAKTGRGSFPMWVATAQFINSILSFLLLLIPSMTNITIIIINVTIFLVFAMWFLFSRDVENY